MIKIFSCLIIVLGFSTVSFANEKDIAQAAINIALALHKCTPTACDCTNCKCTECKCTDCKCTDCPGKKKASTFDTIYNRALKGEKIVVITENAPPALIPIDAVVYRVKTFNGKTGVTLLLSMENNSVYSTVLTQGLPITQSMPPMSPMMGGMSGMGGNCSSGG